ncbi:MAG: hypothetical protein HOG03_20735 [Desulfobacula sp.]|jgi:hypothetical protein|uniref:hypothetical protein n=1 Tax=Desulfobacula sp. TaxID=2593537 RepID=UPI001D6B8F1A|nr:hypothetical protein [Desulfobacula sp.]MBT3485965.1 hypothetical protein [Desulfobacula sp.]MBT3806997.1 hypothetical protein [Desulfobacula sp.]MBT4025504.1 hypothetical protein [Desulfobacula sp.]MBT4198903.1 hypothetical protein [Desulfobacula sp.]
MKKLVTIVATIAVLISSAHAADWNFYGSVMVSTFYENVDISGADTTNLAMGLNSDSVIGAEVNVNDEVGGVFEFEAGNGNVEISYLYGVWNFGYGSLLIGLDDGPLQLPGSDQAYADNAGLGGWGEMASPGKGQIKLIFDAFRLAFRTPSVDYNDGTDNVDINTEVMRPSIEASYWFAGENYNLGITAGYGTFEVGKTNKKDIDSYVIGIGGDVTFGRVILGAGVFGGENVGNLVDTDVNGGDTGAGLARFDGTQVINNKALAWKIHATYIFNDMFGIQAGYGYMETELDKQTKDEVKSYYVQFPITLADGVSIVPEIGTIDYSEVGQSKTDYFGAKWQIDF